MVTWLWGRECLQPFFCFRSNFRAKTRLETLATQATVFSVATLLPTLRDNTKTGCVDIELSHYRRLFSLNLILYISS